MKILHISKYYFPYIGGIETTCKQLVEEMPQHDTAVVCFNEGRKNVVDMVNGHRVYRVGTWVNISRQALSPSYYKVLKRAINEFRPDIIHFHWANPFPAAVLLAVIPKDVKLVIHWHMDIIKQKRIYPFVKPVETALLRKADMIVVTSPQYRDGSLPLQPFKGKVRILASAINENDIILRQGDEEQIQRLKEKYHDSPIVFFVGRHIQYKGLPYLLEAEKHVRENCVFVIAGSGPLTEKLKAECKSARVHFVGRLSDDELRWYHYAASVFVFPSITKNEAFGLALAEAMYCGTPAVTFTIDGSGVNWVSIDGETGIEVPNKDIEAYAGAIDKLLSDEKLRNQYAANGKERVKKMFIDEIMAKTMESYYKQLAAVGDS